ncbi:MAG: hypothetical protein H0W66_12220 [Chthoniobacterales bacterium]|nr:hypothetical protein [Chthoniobacterales bacterium]
MLAAGTLLAASMVNPAAIAGGAANACQKTADVTLSACRGAAQSDYQVAIGKCVNLTDPRARKSCTADAKASLRDALQICQGGFAVRLTACEKLGGAAYDPVIDPANFSTQIDNPYFPLIPGTTFVYEGQTAQGLSHTDFAVTHNTRLIDGVTCVEVRDSVFTDGVLTEDTLDWFAQDTEGNVWYFGENTHELIDGLISTIDGTFMGGLDGDKPGIIMKAHPAVGDFYRQEFSLANAEDEAESLSLDAVVTVPFGTFEHCLQSEETTPLEPDLLEDKFYAAGVGNVLTMDVNSGERIELIQILTGQ